MRVGNASLVIPQGRERDSGHVELPHGQVYTVQLRNHFHRPADVRLEVDGKVVGEWRVHASGFIELERGVDDLGRFTFFRADSAEGQAAQAGSVAPDDRGLVRATFRFQRAPLQEPARVGRSGPLFMSPEGPRLRSMGGQHSNSGGGELYGKAPSFGEKKTSGGIDLQEGVTGLTGASGQRFGSVAPLDVDPALDVTITVRLGACGWEAVRPLQPQGRGNATPHPLG